MDSFYLSPNLFAGQTRKRTRGSFEDDDHDVLFVDEHRYEKKIRSYEVDDLYLNPNTTPSRPFDLHNDISYQNSYGSVITITPPESNTSASSSPANEKATTSPVHDAGYVDMDMSEPSTIPITSLLTMPPPTRPATRPARLNPESLIYNPSGGRLPTPIHGHFLQSQEAPTLSQPKTHPPLCPAQHRRGRSLGQIGNMTIRVPSGAQQMMMQQPSIHMLPSPISEGDPDALADGSLSRLSVVEEKMDIEGDEAMEGGVVASTETVEDESMLGVIDAVQPFSGQRERRRSQTVPAEKKRFCMGYRDDCEKCRQRVPGHFSHFLGM